MGPGEGIAPSSSGIWWVRSGISCDLSKAGPASRVVAVAAGGAFPPTSRLMINVFIPPEVFSVPQIPTLRKFGIHSPSRRDKALGLFGQLLDLVVMLNASARLLR